MNHPNWEKVALELTEGNGVNQLLDVVGGDGLNQSVKATRVGGHISQIGFLQGDEGLEDREADRKRPSPSQPSF
ncbi:zinc-binding dehydrogenase [Granulicella aggregans]|uniref:zinc-binding dehydrogenase n=1 Tax=Granulicella aggregans TaxID=474949 RepID=UPI003D7C1557